MISSKDVDLIVDAIRNAKPSYKGCDHELTDYERGQEQARADVAQYLATYCNTAVRNFNASEFLRRCYLTDDAALHALRAFSPLEADKGRQ